MTSPDEVKKGLVRQWLQKAEEDYGVAEHLLLEKSPFRSAIGFHAQQSSEKFLKAILTDFQIPFPKTHDLGELLDLFLKHDASFAAQLSDITELNPYGVEIRYPADLPDLSEIEVQRAVELAAKTRKAVLDLLNL